MGSTTLYFGLGSQASNEIATYSSKKPSFSLRGLFSTRRTSFEVALDKPTGDKTTLGEQKRLVEKSCQHQFFNIPGQRPWKLTRHKSVWPTPIINPFPSRMNMAVGQRNHMFSVFLGRCPQAMLNKAFELLFANSNKTTPFHLPCPIRYNWPF